MSYIVGPEEEVEVPAGKFKAVPVTSINHLAGRIQKTRHWYAPGVGLIKTAPFDGDVGGTEILKSFTPGK